MSSSSAASSPPSRHAIALRAIANSPAAKITASYSEPDLTVLPARVVAPPAVSSPLASSASGSGCDESVPAAKPLRALAASGASAAYSEPSEMHMSAHTSLDKRPAMQQSLEHSSSAPQLDNRRGSDPYEMPDDVVAKPAVATSSDPYEMPDDVVAKPTTVAAVAASDPYEMPSEAVANSVHAPPRAAAVAAAATDPYEEPSSASASSAPRPLAASVAYSEPDLADSSELNMSAHVALDKKGPLQQSLEHRGSYIEPSAVSSAAYTEPDSSAAGPAAPARAAAAPAASAAPQRVVAPPRAPGERDWNGEFQAILHSESLSTTPIERTVALLRLSDEFCAEAQRIGQVIISELALPNAQKTYKPRDMGGVAGGQKYLEAGVFFKFTRDAFGLYGGDEFSMKAAAHELSGLNAYLVAILAMERGGGGGAVLNVPLMALVDYAGHRLIATCALPIGGRTLCYGSDDSGHTVHADDATLNALMEEAARLMYMKRHMAGNGNVAVREICGPTDIEGHRGRDGKYYVCDTARCFAPNAPSRMFVGALMSVASVEEMMDNRHNGGSRWSATELPLTTRGYVDEIKALVGARMARRTVGDIEIFFNPFAPRINVAASWLVGFVVSGDAVVVPGGIKSKILYQLFRREFMMDVYKKALSPDAFSGFGVHNRAEHNAEVREATRVLLHDVIPAFAKKLENHDIVPATHHQLVAQLHAHGINARYLARVRSLLPASEQRLRNMLMVEMQIRCMKKLLWAALRQREPLEGERDDLDTCRRVVADFLNRALGGSRQGQMAWNTALQVRLQLKFSSEGYSIDTTESMSVSSKLYLVQTLLDIAGVRLAPECLERMQRAPDAFFAEGNRRPFAPHDVESLEIRSRRLVSVDDANMFFDAQLERLLAAHPAADAARVAAIEQHVGTVTALFGERSERSTMWYVTGAFYVARVAVALHRAAGPGAQLPATGDARRAFTLAHGWLDAMLRCNDGDGQFEVELLACLFHVRGLLARIEMPPGVSLGVDIVAESYQRAAIQAFDSLQSLGSGDDRKKSQGLRHPFRFVIIDALLDVLLARESEVRHSEVESLSHEFVEYLIEHPVSDFERALGGVPALARFGSVALLNSRARTERMRQSFNDSHSVGALLVSFVREPGMLPYEAWRRVALLFNHKLGTYNYAALESTRVATMHELLRSDAYTESRLPPTALAGTPVTLQFTLRSESTAVTRPTVIFAAQSLEVRLYCSEQLAVRGSDRLSFISPDLTRFNRMSGHDIVRDREPVVRVPFISRSCAMRGGPPPPPPLRTKAVCKKEHALTLQSRDDGNYAGGWSCDGCRASHAAGVRRFCCLPCGYDLCDECGVVRCAAGHKMLYVACADDGAPWQCSACATDGPRDQVHFQCILCEEHLCDVHALVGELHREPRDNDADDLLWTLKCELFDDSSEIVTGAVTFQTRTWRANECYFAAVASDRRVACVSNYCLLYDGASYARSQVPLFYSPVANRFWSYGPWLGTAIAEVGTAWSSSDKFDALPRLNEPLFVRDSDGRVWTVGNNGAQWARAHGGNRENPYPVMVRELVGKRVVSLAVGGFISDVHVVAATSDGDVFAWGSNHHGELGVGDQVDRSTPTLVRALQGVNVAQVSAGCRTTLARTASGAVWHWGGKANTEGRNTGEPVTPAQLTAFPSGVRYAHCAIYSDQSTAYAVVMLDGAAFVWGAIGRRYLHAPARLGAPAGVGVQKIVYGRDHMLMLDFDGRVYAFGDNDRGQLATELPLPRRDCVATHETEIVFEPIAALRDVCIVDIVTGSNQSVALSDKGAVFHWGTHRPSLECDPYGECALPSEPHHYRQPTRLRCPDVQSFAGVAATDSFLFLQPGAPRAPLNDEHVVEFRRRRAAAAVASAENAAPVPRVEVTVDASRMPLVRVSWRRRAGVPEWQRLADRILLMPKNYDNKRTRVRDRIPVFLPQACDVMSEHAAALAAAERVRFEQLPVMEQVLKGDWTFEIMPQLGDDVGFFDFDVRKGLFIEPGEYECVVFTTDSHGGNLEPEFKVPAFTLAEQSALVSVDLSVPTSVDANGNFTITVRYQSATMPWDERDVVALYRFDEARDVERAECRLAVSAEGVVELVAPLAPGVYAVRLERQLSPTRARVLASARLSVTKPARKRSTLQLDGEVLRFGRKAAVSWDIEASLSVKSRELELSSCYIAVFQTAITEDTPADEREVASTASMDNKARGSTELYMPRQPDAYRAHVVMQTSAGTYFIASSHEFHVIDTVPREVVQIALTSPAPGADGVVRTAFGTPVQIEWSVEPSFWSEYDGWALVRPGTTQPAAYVQVATPNGSASLTAMLGEYVLEYRAFGSSGHVSVPMDDLPRIVVGSAPAVAAPAVAKQQPASTPMSSGDLRVHESVARGGGQLHLSCVLPASRQLSGGDFIGVYEASSEPVITVPPVGAHRLESRECNNVAVYTMPVEGRFVLRLWALDLSVGMVLVAQSNPFELSLDDAKVAAAAAAASAAPTASSSSSSAAGGWGELMLAAGMSADDAQTYEALLVANDFSIDLMADLDRDVLKDIGITKVGHQVRILKEIATRLKQ